MMEWDTRNVVMTGNSDGVVRVSPILDVSRGVVRLQHKLQGAMGSQRVQIPGYMEELDLICQKL